MKLDLKFYGEIRKAKDDSIVPDDRWMCFLAQDNAFMPTLIFYRNKCVELGCDDEHIAAVNETIERVKEWRRINVEKCKNPDAKGERLLRQCG